MAVDRSEGPSPQTIRPSGGRRQPRTSELKDAAEERIVKLFEKGDKGCKLTSPPLPLSKKDKSRLKKQKLFASSSLEDRLDILHSKLIDLQDRKISLSGKPNRVLDQQIERLEKQIFELIEEM